jgi:hypothetical protein
VFDEDVEYVDSPEDEINTSHPKGRKIYIETPQDCKDLEKNVKNALYKAMNYYWNVPNDYAMIGALLDPRCKELRFASDRLKVQTQKELRSIYKNYIDQKDYDYNNKDNDQIYDNSLLTSMFMQNTKESDEVADYLAIPQIRFNDCPLEWWKMNEKRFPILSILAKVYLCIPATSTPSERLFSNAGNLMTVKRTQLSNSTFEHLLFLKKNCNLAGGIFPKNDNVFSIIQD